MTPPLAFTRPEQRPAWADLQALAHSHPLHLRQLLTIPDRNECLCIQGAGLVLDATHQRVDAAVLTALQRLSDQSQLLDHIHALFRGDAVNATEGLRWH